ncbi:polar localization protein TipN [Phenylobacterium sp. LjRoot225]|uniref:polar localization protein TipN n=1 Tax=Phenylobacterium sp. LjRoot225 TaxID=3342285 RepID=UPI003ECC97D4
MKITRRPPPTDFGASNDDGMAAAAPETAGREEIVREEAPVEAEALAAETPAEEPVPRPISKATRAKAAAAAAILARPPPPAPAPAAWPLYLTAFAVAVLWAAGPIAFAVGYRGGVAPLQNDGFALMVFGLLAIGPAALVFGVAYFIRQGQTLAAESRRARQMEQTLLSPALRAAAEAGEVTRAVREEIAAAAQAADTARQSLTALREVLSAQTEGLSQATHASLNAAQQLTGELGRERGELHALTQALESQAVRAAEVIDQQTQKVAGASRAAETQLRDAESALAARAIGLVSAAEEASGVARTAGEDLARHIARLETAGLCVADQVRAVEGGLTDQRLALAALAQTLREDHQGFAAEADAHGARLDDFIGQARRAASEMSERAVDAGGGLRALIAEAAERFAELSANVRVEREALGETAAVSLAAITRAAGDQRARLELDNRQSVEALARAGDEIREAAARHAAAAREQVDQLSEAAFVAGQKANQVFEARLEEARALVEQSAKMVGDAGAVAARKLDEGAVAARATLDELNEMMAAIEARTRDLPADARAQAEVVRAAVGEGIDALMAHARRTAEEAQAIDLAFQERVRRNFDMLSEAVRLMGTVAAAPEPALAAAPPVATPPQAPPFTAAYAPPTVRAAAPPLEPVAKPAKAKSEARPEPASEPKAAPEPSPTASSGLAERLGLRPRLKLTPTASDQEFSAIFEAAGGAGPAAKPTDSLTPPAAAEAEEADEEEPAETWTWKDLLASLGGGDGAQESDEAVLSAELGKMGVEPEKLLPEARIGQIAAAMQTGDLDGARQVVKKLAGAASRRIVRRLFTDEALKTKASTFVRRYQALVDDAAVRDPEGVLMAEILGSGSGRAFLLLDQALGDAA